MLGIVIGHRCLRKESIGDARSCSMTEIQRQSRLVVEGSGHCPIQGRVSVAEWFPIQHRITQGDRLEIDFGFRAQVRNQDHS